MKTYQFKQLDIKPQGSWFERLLKSAHFKKTLRAAFFGAVIGYLLYFVSDGVDSGIYWNDAAFSNLIMGLGFGIFITNSPCARGKC